MTRKACWTMSALLVAIGVALMVSHFDAMIPWFFVGLTLLLCGSVLFNAGLITQRSRTLDEEFDAGYRVGYRAGRRVGGPTLVHLDDRRRDARLSQAPLGAVAGDGQAP